MRNRALTAIAVASFSMVQLACGADASSDGTAGTSDINGTAVGEAPAPADLASAPIGGGASRDLVGTDMHAKPVNGAGNGDGDGSGAGNGSADGANADPGPKPAATCTVTKDGAGFFTRTSSKSSYVAYVPASYSGTAPMRLIVGLHGCGDNAMNFATWGVNPNETRKTQQHIGISIGGADGRCWSLGNDDEKVLAAVDDISKCFWVHQKKVVVAGFSSGGQMAYRVGLQKASRFAGILIEDSSLYAADANPDALLAKSAWKINIAHRTHTSDPVFPLAKVKLDWVKMRLAGFPLLTSETPGGHDGVSADWATWLIPQSAGFVAP